MNQLTNAGLVARKRSDYFLTSFGEVVYKLHLIIGRAIENYWKLKAIDLLEPSIPDNSLSAEQRKKLIDTLIESSDIKNILLNQSISSDTIKQISGPSKISKLNETPVAY
jgi:ABC-type Zn uptake system ZnuABC Zn-binding protein ZnuA